MIELHPNTLFMNALRLLKFYLIFAFFISFSACGTNDSSGGTNEETLDISVEANTLEVVPGSEHTFNVRVSSIMPPGGVKLEISVRTERDNQLIHLTGTPNTRAALTTCRILYLPRQVICVCTVKATSLSDTDNTATKTFRIVYK
jgi:hypothetical protein